MGLRVACVAAFAGLSAGAGSCGASGSSNVNATGKTLSLYASVPVGSPGAADTTAAEKLALQQGGSRIGTFAIRLITLSGTKPSDNARQAISDQSTVAYIGELHPGNSADSMGITNAEDVLQVSPGDTAIELTQSTATVPGAPDTYYEDQKTYGRTFARVVPSGTAEANAQVSLMSSLGVKRLYVSSDGSTYGAAIALAVRQAAAKHGVTVVPAPAGADGAFYGAGSGAAAGRRFDALSASDPAIKLFAPSGAAAGLSTSARTVYVTSPGFVTRSLPPLGHTFVSQFRAAYGHAPAAGAIFAYEAVKAVLDVLREAGSSANQRATVVRDFFGIRNRSSPLGTYSIDSGGDISVAPFIVSRLHAGKLVPLRSIPAQG